MSRTRVILAFALAIAIPLAASAADLRQLLQRFDRLAAAKDFAAAETVAREAVTQFPASRDAKLALGNALLWQAKYDESQRVFRGLLARNPQDVDARLGLANALYWSGDLRSAESEYARLRGSAAATRALGEIRSATSPSLHLDLTHRSDTQPLRTTFGEVGGSVFSDPLTRWDGAAGAYRFDAATRDADASFVRGGVEAAFPQIRTTLRASASMLRFPDGETRPIGLAGIDRRIGSSTLSLTASRHELFGSEEALDTHAYADSIELRWSRPNASARVESLRYFDDNSGLAADAWALFPVGSLSFGGSIAYRDTRESRFVSAGVYDPYWTPINLREARLIAVGSRKLGRATAGFHADAGVADEDLNGRFNPWRASLSLGIDLGKATMTLEAGRESTVFYTANEISARVARRF